MAPTVPLSVLRTDPASWSTVDYAPDGANIPQDANADAREALIEALAADRGDTDGALLRHVLAQEAVMHAEGWGYRDALGLAALLVAELGSTSDVWALWQAKNASYDTFTGLSGALLFGAGVPETLAAVEAAEHPDRAALLAYLGTDPPAAAEVAEELSWLREYHGI